MANEVCFRNNHLDKPWTLKTYESTGGYEVWKKILDGKTPAEEIGLYYELALAYELLDDPQEAIYYLQKVVKRDETFRDGKSRLERLSTPEAALPQQPDLVLDEVDAAFDDLMDD